MEKDMFKFKIGGRTSEQTFTNAMTLLKYIDKLQPNKMYGIMKAGTSITLLTKNEVIPKSLIKEKIEELDIQISECEYADDDIEERKQDIEKEKRLLLRDKKTLQDLLGKE